MIDLDGYTRRGPGQTLWRSLRSFGLVAVLLLAFPGPPGHAENYEDQLAEIRSAYQGDIEKLNVAYLAGLNKLASAYTARKQLNAALAVQREIKGIQSGGRLPSLGTDAPPELTNARRQYAQRRKALSDRAQAQKATLDAARPRSAEPAPAPDPVPATIAKVEVTEVPKEKKSPSSGPPEAFSLKPNRTRGPDSDKFREEVWKEDVTLRPGTYRMRDMISVTNQPGPTVVMEAGTVLKDGVLFFGQGSLEANGVFFEDQKISLDLGGYADFENCYLKECIQAKAGRWVSVALFSGKWSLYNCYIDRSFFQRWGSYTVGVLADYCTFNQVDFPEFAYYNDVDLEAGSPRIGFQDCRFVRCEIPISMLILTDNCVFERCKFVKHKLNKPIDEEISITVHLVDHIGKVADFHDLIRIEVQEGDRPEAGAKLTLAK